MDYHHPPQHQERPTSGKSTVKSESSDLSGTTDTPSLATSATTESPDDENNDNDRRLRGVHDDSLFRAVAVCMLEYMS